MDCRGLLDLILLESDCKLQEGGGCSLSTCKHAQHMVSTYLLNGWMGYEQISNRTADLREPFGCKISKSWIKYTFDALLSSLEAGEMYFTPSRKDQNKRENHSWEEGAVAEGGALML